jgi:branched-chain amino acid transport system ATP-binding protein
VLSVSGLSVFHDEVQAVASAELKVSAGEIVTIVGANGAGKTTLMRTISGLLRPASGEILFDGLPIHRSAPDAIVRHGLIHVPEGRHIFPTLSVEDNLRVGAHLVRSKAVIRATFERVYSLFPRLLERRKQAGGTLSGGEQQMLALGRAMMSQPRLLLLDEPSLGLAPLVVEEIGRTISILNEAGIAILLVEQNALMALGLCDRGYVMVNGKIVHSDTGTALLNSADIIQHFLGGAPTPPEANKMSKIAGSH